MNKELFLKYLENRCSKNELNSINEWFTNHALNQKDINLIEEIWNEFKANDIVINESEAERLLDRIHHKINMKQSVNTPKKTKTIFPYMPPQRILAYLTRVAAVLFLPIFFTMLYFASNTKSLISRIEGNNMIELVTPVGSITKSTLPDGTVFWLNHNSTLTYPIRFGNKDRVVYLQGEAYFNIASDKNKPFKVSIDDYEVEAVGTEFNIRVYKEENTFETSLVSGTVIVNKKISGRDPQKIVELKPGQQLRVNFQGKAYRKIDINVDNYISWKDGKLIFRDAPLEFVLNRLGTKYNVDFIILDKDIEDLPYTATFTGETLPQILELLEKAAPLEFYEKSWEDNGDGSFKKKQIHVTYNKK